MTSNIQQELYTKIESFYNGLYTRVDELADREYEPYKDMWHANVTIGYNVIVLKFHQYIGIEPVRLFRQALLKAKEYNLNKSSFTDRRVIDDVDAGVAGSPIELDKLSVALNSFHQALHPKEELQDHDRNGLFYDKYIYPLYDCIMLAKWKLVTTALREQDTAVGCCLADLIKSRLAGTPKGNQFLAEVMECLKQQERDQHKYMMSVLNEKEGDQNSILDGVDQDINNSRGRRFDDDKSLEKQRQCLIDQKIYELKNKEPHKSKIADMNRDSMRQWLNKHINDKNMRGALKKHRSYFSWYKDTYSERCLQVAMVSDFIKENPQIYGKAFLKAYNALSISSNKAFLVAEALQKMRSQKISESNSDLSKEDFISALEGENPLTKALKMRMPGMSSVFGSSKTWQSVQDEVLKELCLNREEGLSSENGM